MGGDEEMIQELLKIAIVNIPFKTLEMLQQANEESVLLLEIFKKLKKYEQKDQNKQTNLEYDLRLIVIIDNRLYIKKNGEDSIAVFSNNLFSNLNSKKQYLLFIEVEHERVVSKKLKAEVLNLLKSMKRKIKYLSAKSIDLKSDKIILHEIIQAKLGV